ncbi:MAG: peptidylprolyl isomerase [Deltaproteobacteria bacterium]|nr:peptidylprolyl isomerase [Deltaproteobacteria bacterium]
MNNSKISKKERVVTQVSSEKRDEFEKRAFEAVTDDFLRNYYEKNKQKFMEPERLHLRSILVKADPGGGAVVWNESKRKAEEILKQAKSGKDFAKLAEEFSEDRRAVSEGTWAGPTWAAYSRRSRRRWRLRKWRRWSGP